MPATPRGGGGGKARLSASALLLLLFPGLAASAADEAPLGVRGQTLGEFEVLLRAARIDSSSPEALARSYCALVAAAGNECAGHFTRLSAAAHLEILERYYSPELVRKQEEAYDAVLRASERVECVVLGCEGDGSRALATVERRGASKVKLVLSLERSESAWRIAKIEQEAEGGVRIPRDLGVPPLLIVRPVGPPAPPDFTSPETALASLRHDMERLWALRARGQNELNRHYFQIVRAFYGDDVATKARDARKAPEPALPVEYETTKAMPLEATTLRIEAIAWEKVPGATDLRSAVGEASFDFRRDAEGRWRIEKERNRPKPGGQMELLPSGFGLFFLH
jgi:hypothetical protein